MHVLAGTLARSCRIPRDRLNRVEGQASTEGTAGNDGHRTHLVFGFEQVPVRAWSPAGQRLFEGSASVQIHHVFEAGGNNPYSSDAPHEIDITLPSRHKVGVQVAGEASPACGTFIDAHVDALRVQLLLHELPRVLDEIPECHPLRG